MSISLELGKGRLKFELFAVHYSYCWRWGLYTNHNDDGTFQRIWGIHLGKIAFGILFLRRWRNP